MATKKFKELVNKKIEDTAPPGWGQLLQVFLDENKGTKFDSVHIFGVQNSTSANTLTNYESWSISVGLAKTTAATQANLYDLRDAFKSMQIEPEPRTTNITYLRGVDDGRKITQKQSYMEGKKDGIEEGRQMAMDDSYMAGYDKGYEDAQRDIENDEGEDF